MLTQTIARRPTPLRGKHGLDGDCEDLVDSPMNSRFGDQSSRP